VRTHLRRWTDVDLPLLEAANAPEMTAHLGGPEADAQVRRRHERYLRTWDEGVPRMYAIVDDAGVGLGGIGWWESDWAGAGVYETGWSVLPEFQGRGVASGALRLLIADVRANGTRRYLTAFPAVGNVPSNALARSAGFELRGTMRETFRGAEMDLNVWVLDLASQEWPRGAG